MLKILTIIFFVSSIIFAQENDSTWSFWKSRLMDMNPIEITRAPTITINYGLSSMDLYSFNDSFEDPNLIEVKLGYTTEMPLPETSYLINYKYNNLFLSRFSTSLGKTPAANKIESDAWRFGFNHSSGYGYTSGSFAVIPYTSSSFIWTKVDFPESSPVLLQQNEIDRLDIFDEAFRFGTAAEGGLRIKVIREIALDISYERGIVFPRHLFWKWAGSALIELAANFSLDNFVNEILELQPAIAPVVNFVLKNGLAYGLYELRQEKMNWPFDSAPPLSFDQVKFGLTFVFGE